jgi:hypothetical protein
MSKADPCKGLLKEELIRKLLIWRKEDLGKRDKDELCQIISPKPKRTEQNEQNEQNKRNEKETGKDRLISFVVEEGQRRKRPFRFKKDALALV